MPNACQLHSEIVGKDVDEKGISDKGMTWRKVR